MSRTSIAGLLSLCMMAASTAANAADYVTSVYACGENGAVIYLQSGKKLLLYLPDTTADQFARMYAMSLELLASQKQIGYYNNVATITTCGIAGLQEITVLQAMNSN